MSHAGPLARHRIGPPQSSGSIVCHDEAGKPSSRGGVYAWRETNSQDRSACGMVPVEVLHGS